MPEEIREYTDFRKFCHENGMIPIYTQDEYMAEFEDLLLYSYKVGRFIEEQKVIYYHKFNIGGNNVIWTIWSRFYIICTIFSCCSRYISRPTIHRSRNLPRL